ncbi:hypothetical protein Leryth_004941 [Lithospermum erythrorhizon]|nr:hypothetical protein Leryth_004941 [Lithospermum erythrorhizon]
MLGSITYIREQLSIPWKTKFRATIKEVKDMMT